MGRIVNKSGTERKFLVVYTVLALAVLLAGISASTSFQMFLGTVPEILFCWGIYALQKGDGASRAVIMTVSSLVTMAFFGVMVTSMDILVPLFAVLLVMIGMFNSSLLPGLWAADAALMFLYHLLIQKSYDLGSGDDRLRLFYQVFCLGAMLYLEEVTIRKNLERKRQMSEKMELQQQSARNKDELIAAIFRKFKTPLNVISDRSNSILECDTSEKVKEAAKDLLASARNMQEIARDASDYAEIESVRQELKEEAYSLDGLLKDISDAAYRQNEGGKLEIIVDCDGDVPSAMVGDSEKIRRIIMCLLGNALKYTRKGSVTLKVSAQKESSGVNLCICVRDTGVGMTKETVAGIQSAFGRGDAETDRRFGSVGFSLALTGCMAEMMGGSIDVESEPGKGSEFRVVIPQKVVDENILQQRAK